MSEITGEDPVEQCLRTELILDVIFKWLPIRELLSCSLVNKLWYYQARLYLRDHRKCTPFISYSIPCSQLEAFDDFLGGISIVHFNSLQIPIGGHQFCSEAGHEPAIKLKNLMFKMKLKHLFISVWNLSIPAIKVCPSTFVPFALLRHNAREIQSLRLQKLPLVLLKILLRVEPKLPKLVELKLRGMPEGFWEEEEAGDLLEVIPRASCKLKRINHDGDPKILHVLPQDKYHMLTKFKCDDLAQSTDLEERCKKLANSGPALTDFELWISASTEEQRIRNSYEMLQLFVCSSWKSLKRLQILRLCPLHSMMTIPTLEKLFHLRLHSFVGSDRFMEMIQPVQFGRLFPKLESISLESYEGGNVPGIFSRSPQLEDETKVDVLPGSPQHSSASEAEIIADVCHIRFVQLKQLIPLVTNLSFCPSPNSAHAVPFRQIFRLWPHLKKLRVAGQVTQELYNCDAEFCGIDQAEVELLWLMEEEELKKLHIVPRRPCPITMTSLKSVEVVLSLRYNFETLPRERSQKFLSVVTKCLLLERAPGFNLGLQIFPGDDNTNVVFYIND